MMEAPVSRIPNDYLREYIRSTEDVKRHPEEAGIEREEDADSREIWANRNQELRRELARRREEGTFIDNSNSPDPSEGSCPTCKEANSPSPNNNDLPSENSSGENNNDLPGENSNQGESYPKRRRDISDDGSDSMETRPAKKLKEDSVAEGNKGISAGSPEEGSLSSSNSNQGESDPKRERDISDDGSDSMETRPAKKFKQDSSDITGDSEPFQIWGDD